MVGQIVAIVKLPVYLDSIGTVLVGALAGPAAGAVTGALSNLLIGLISNPAWIPFALVAAAVGAVAGWLGGLGAYRSVWTAIPAGAFCGIVAAAASSPVSAYLFGGVTGGGTDLIVALFRSQGLSALAASFSQGLATDPLDKALTFAVVAWALAASPARLLDQYPRGLRSCGREAPGWDEDRGLRATRADTGKPAGGREAPAAGAPSDARDAGDPAGGAPS